MSCMLILSEGRHVSKEPMNFSDRYDTEHNVACRWAAFYIP